MSVVTSVASAGRAVEQSPIRVMVVDDSVVVRGLIAHWIEQEPGLEVVASLRTGRQAVDQFDRVNPDIVILDVEMPELDGLSALPLLLAKKPDLVVIMASTLTRRNAEISIKALSLGAVDYLPKPDSTRAVTTSHAFRRELIEKVFAFGNRLRRPPDKQPRREPVPRPGVPRPGAPRPGATRPSATRQPALLDGRAGKSPIKLRPFSKVPPQALVIGASTGGPQALMTLVGQLDDMIAKAPVLVTQHMPPTFTTILAQHLARLSRRTVHEGRDGEAVAAGTVYIAPGGRHMRVTSVKGRPVIALDDGPLINFCKPAVDPLFHSAVEVWGNGVLALVLTGLGNDGRRGAAEIVTAGGSVIAQDEATSIVWGMPGAVAKAGLCAAVLPLDEIAAKVTSLFGGRR
jgi:two-component system chemotaxis response regulator CheB